MTVIYTFRTETATHTACRDVLFCWLSASCLLGERFCSQESRVVAPCALLAVLALCTGAGDHSRRLVIMPMCAKSSSPGDSCGGASRSFFCMEGACLSLCMLAVYLLLPYQPHGHTTSAPAQKQCMMCTAHSVQHCHQRAPAESTSRGTGSTGCTMIAAHALVHESKASPSPHQQHKQ